MQQKRRCDTRFQNAFAPTSIQRHGFGTQYIVASVFEKSKRIFGPSIFQKHSFTSEIFFKLFLYFLIG